MEETMAEVNNGEPIPGSSPIPQVQLPLEDLIASLEQATLMARQLSSATDPTQVLHIYSSLSSTSLFLSSFLQNSHPPLLVPPPQPLVVENSVSSTVGPADAAEPMQEEDENSGNTIIDRVEERLRDCFIVSKRPKRAMSPTYAAEAERRRVNEDYEVREIVGFNPNATRLRSLDLISQFHL